MTEFPKCSIIRSTIIELLKEGSLTTKDLTNGIVKHLELPEELAKEKTSSGGDKLGIRVSVQVYNLIKDNKAVKDEQKRISLV